MYYVFEIKYSGVNYLDHCGRNRIEIRSQPASKYALESVIDDWAVYDHGEYTTIEQARDSIKAKFGEVQYRDEDGCSYEYLGHGDPEVIEVYSFNE
jgi:hypothetical protein